ncbi:hypothetical protein [Dactylosporangium cerinum]
MTVDPRLQSWALDWADVDPAAHPFDPASVPAVVRAAAPAGLPGPDDTTASAPDPRRTWVDAVTLGLVDRYGRWAADWQEPATGHTADGGLTLRWCCARHSITTREQTLATIAGALLDWRSYLEEVAECFARHLPLPDEPQAAFAAWETAVGDLVATAAARTASAEHWYGDSGRVLTWFLAAAGVPDHLCRAMVDDAIGGRFRAGPRRQARRSPTPRRPSPRRSPASTRCLRTGPTPGRGTGPAGAAANCPPPRGRPGPTVRHRRSMRSPFGGGYGWRRAGQTSPSTSAAR